MTQQVASITCSHRGLKAFQSRLVGALERKNLHRSRCEQQGNGVRKTDLITALAFPKLSIFRRAKLQEGILKFDSLTTNKLA
jgi:hypothetical protein